MSPTSQDNSRTVLVTGATGFIGTHLCRALAGNGWQILATTRCDSGEHLPAGIRTANLEFFSEPDRWRDAMRSCHAVVHLAACVHRMGAAARLESDYHRLNVEGSCFVAQQAIFAGVPRFVFLSSIKVNGEGSDRPYRWDDVPNPRDAYGRSKWAAEQSLRALCASRGTELVIIRPPVVYGPGVKANFRRMMQLASWGVPVPFASIVNRRSFIGVRNLVSFIETCINHPAAPQQTWLIADGEDLSTPELMSRLFRLMHRRARMFGVSPAWMKRIASSLSLRDSVDRLCESLQIDATAARRTLNWRPPVSLDDELARTVAAYFAERKR